MNEETKTITTLVNLTKKAVKALNAYERETGMERALLVAKAVEKGAVGRTIRASDIDAAFDAIIEEDKAAEQPPSCPAAIRDFLKWCEREGTHLIDAPDTGMAQLAGDFRWVILDRKDGEENDLDRIWYDYEQEQKRQSIVIHYSPA